MPTGYTYDVAEGEITTLRAFAVSCARGMGALIHMRDEPHGVALPDAITADVQHYDEQIEYYAKELEFFNASPIEILRTMFESENTKIRDRNEQSKQKHTLLRERYESMIAKVAVWQGAPEGLKEFMLQQLIDSMNFDVPEPGKEYFEEEHESIEEWIDSEREHLERSIERYKKYRQEEIDRCEGRNAWLQKLYRSLEGVE